MFQKKGPVFINSQTPSAVLEVGIVITFREEGSSAWKWSMGDSHGVSLMFYSLMWVEVTWVCSLSENSYMHDLYIFCINFVSINRLNINPNWEQKRL